MKNKIKALLIIIILLVLFIGFFIGVIFNDKMFDAYDIQMWKYSCQDGCSIATKNKTNNFLTNETFDCWEKCNDYIEKSLRGGE